MGFWHNRSRILPRVNRLSASSVTKIYLSQSFPITSSLPIIVDIGIGLISRQPKDLRNMSSQVKDINYQIDAFVEKLKRRQISGSYLVALETCQLLMRVVSAARWNHTDQLIDQIRQLGKTLINAQPREFTTGNVIRRVLAIIRDEVNDSPENDSNAPMISSMFSLLSTNVEKKEPVTPAPPANPRIHHSKNHDLRSIIIQGIRDLIDEISNIDEGIEAMSVDLIHDNEILLTPTPDSQTVLKFLLKARQKRKFTVLVTECFPNRTTTAHSFAKQLSDAKIETVVIPDSHVFAVMSRVGKVIVGARSVFANGGTVSSAGVAAVCECAKEHKTPVFSVAGLYKLSPTYPFDVENLIEVGNSGKVINFSDSKLVQHADITNPLFDYIPPEHIDIYITNIGGYAPSFIYRIVLDNYKSEDVDLD